MIALSFAVYFIVVKLWCKISKIYLFLSIKKRTNPKVVCPFYYDILEIQLFIVFFSFSRSFNICYSFFCFSNRSFFYFFSSFFSTSSRRSFLNFFFTCVVQLVEVY